jgi:hypothetical protein
MGTIERCRDDIFPKRFPNVAIIYQSSDRVAILPVQVCSGLLHVASSCYIGDRGLRYHLGILRISQCRG